MKKGPAEISVWKGVPYAGAEARNRKLEKGGCFGFIPSAFASLGAEMIKSNHKRHSL